MNPDKTVRRLLPVLALTGLLIFPACRQKTISDQELLIDSLMVRLEDMKQLLSAEYLDSIYRYRDEMRDNLRLLEEDAAGGMVPEDIQPRLGAYRDAFQVLDHCLDDCPALQKEISFIENDLMMLRQEWISDQMGQRDFENRFAREEELMEGITERVYRGHDTALEQVLVHKEQRGLFDSLIMKMRQNGHLSPVE